MAPERDTRTNEVKYAALPSDVPGADPQAPEASKADGARVVT